MLVFVVGVLWRLGAILIARRKVDLSVPRTSGIGGAIKTVFSRFVADRGTAPHIRLQIIAGYLFHLGLFALLFFAAPHVRFLDQQFLGFSWASMPHWVLSSVQNSHFSGY